MTTLTAPVVHRGTNTVRLALQGEIDLSTREVLDRAIGAALTRQPRPRTVLIDLDRVGFCDCGGVGILLKGRAATVSRGVGYQVVNARGIVRRVLRVLGVDEMLLAAGTGPDRAEGSC
jgi:anti-anti-sigma factor